MHLTPAGLHYSRQVSARLNELERDTLAAMGKHGTNNILELAVVPTFGTRWLLPRLAGFREQHPDITVNLTNRTRPFLFADTRFDAAIYFGDGQWPGTTAVPLMHEEPVPVCHRTWPAMAPGRRGHRPAAAAAANHPALYVAGLVRFPGLEGGPGHGRPPLRAVHHARRGGDPEDGVALIPPFLITKELDSGQLVIPFRHSFRSNDAYQFVVPDSQRGNETLAHFQTWLVDAARRFSDTPAA